jgi:hypothetical protein
MSVVQKINAASVDNFPLYAEHQLYELCAKHALNNILQEEKIGYYPNGPLLINKYTGKGAVESETLMDYHIQLNIWKYCDYADYIAVKDIIKGSGFPENFSADKIAKIQKKLDKGILPSSLVEELGSESACKKKHHDSISFDHLENLVKALGYKIETSRAYFTDVIRNNDGRPKIFKRKYTNSSGVTKIIEETHRNAHQTLRPDFWDEFAQKLLDNKLIGVLINKGAWHYTAVSKFAKGCTQWERNSPTKIVPTTFTFLDSFPEIKTLCHKLTDMIEYLKVEETVNSVIYVYDSACAYNSVAVNRRRRLISSRPPKMVSYGTRKTGLRKTFTPRNTRKGFFPKNTSTVTNDN